MSWRDYLDPAELAIVGDGPPTLPPKGYTQNPHNPQKPRQQSDSTGPRPIFGDIGDIGDRVGPTSNPSADPSTAAPATVNFGDIGDIGDRTERVTPARHPCPPLPRSFRWRDSSPLAELDTDPDDTRIRCAYCRHWKTTQRHGRLLPWCSIKDDWEEPSTLHHCTVERFELDPAHRWRRWLLPDDGGAGGNGHG